MKIALTVVAVIRAVLWLCLLPWLVLVAWYTLKGMTSSPTAVQEAAAAAMGCVAAFVPYAMVRSLDEASGQIEKAIERWWE